MGKSWKIAQVPLKYPPALGGVERLVEQQCGLLSRAGHTVTVLTTRLDGFTNNHAWPEQEEREGVAIRRFIARKIPGIKYPIIPGLSSALRAGEFDLLHAHSFWYNNFLAAARAHRDTGVKLVAQPYYDPKSNLFHDLYRKFYGRFLLAADAVIVISRFEETLLRRAHLPLSNVHILPPPVELDEFIEPRRMNDDLVARLRIADRRIYLNVGRVSYGKGIDTLVGLARRMRAVKAEGKIVVVGPDAGGFAAFAREIANENLDDYIVLAGALPRAELLSLYQNADCYVHASRYEAFGIVLIEAMAAGIPVVAPNATAIPEVIDHGSNGLLYPAGDVAGLLAVLSRLEREPGVRQHLIDAGRRVAQGKYTPEKFLPALEAIYRSLLTG